MKSTRFAFGRALALLCTLLFVSFSFMSCQTETDTEYVDNYIYVLPLDSSSALIGDWISSYGEKYSITSTDYDNYSHYDSSYNYDAGNWYLYYSTNNLYVYADSDTTGYIYCQFDDEDYIGYGATVNQWYAIRYKDLTSSSVSLSQAYKTTGIAGADSLEEAVTEFTVANGYFSSYSECAK